MTQTWSKSSATCGWSFKQLQDKSQEQLTVYMHALPLGSDFGTPYFRLVAASEFVAKPTISTICCRLYDQYSLTPCCTLLVFVALLCKAQKFVGLVQSWAFMAFQPAIGWYCPRENWLLFAYNQHQLWQEVCELFPLRTFEQHWLHLSLSLAGL